MLRAYVLDDEPLAVKRLTRMLEATGRVELVGSSSDPEAALAFLRAHAVDALFLDVQMPVLTGFELLDQLESQPLVVFTTAYDRYALNAFDVNSIDYLLKPIEPERLDRALDKLERLGGQPRRDMKDLARELAAELRGRAADPGRGDVRVRPLERIASKVGERTTVLDVARISHFSARDKLTFAVVNGREHVVDFTLSELEARLDARRFVRIHRATIANLGFVQELFPDVDAARQAQGAASESKGGVLIRLKDEGKTVLSVARDRVRDLKDRLGI